MGKIVQVTHIRGDKGVNKFEHYCLNHKPPILFREITKNDFGIDGEVELTRTATDGKTVATGELLKVQLKATTGGYLRNEDEKGFQFIAKKEDFEYWSKYSLRVLLVVYHENHDQLFVRKIDLSDFVHSTKKIKSKKTIPIYFSKIENILIPGQHDFVERFSKEVWGRVSYDVNERLSINLFPFVKTPRFMFSYDTTYKTKKEIYKDIDEAQIPEFVIYGGKVYTFLNVTNTFRAFKEKVVDANSKQVLTNKTILADKTLRNFYVELMNIYIRQFLRERALHYNKDYHRFYFGKPQNSDSKVIEYGPRRRSLAKKTVVNKYTYGRNIFYRHVAYELKYVFSFNDIYVNVIPKYLFTSDGRITIEPDKITKFTNYLTAREYNNQVLNQIHMWFNYLSRGENYIEIANNDNLTISVGNYLSKEVPFGIPRTFKQEITEKRNDRKSKSQSQSFDKQLSFFE